MDFVPLIAALSFAWKLVDVAKFIRAQDWNALLTQIVTWAAGVAVIFMLAASDFAPDVKIGAMELAKIDWVGLLLIGLTVSSSASVAYDFKKSFDNTDSAATPTLLSRSRPGPRSEV